MIRGITEQANLLALSAAIAASRVAEHSRGLPCDDVCYLAYCTQQSMAQHQHMTNSLRAVKQRAMQVMPDRDQ